MSFAARRVWHNIKYDERLPEYKISTLGIMVLYRACDKYLELLNGKSDLYLGQIDQDDNCFLQTAAFCTENYGLY